MFDKNPNILSMLRTKKVLSASDIFFSSLLCGLCNENSEITASIYALSAQQTGMGHICIDLESEHFRYLLEETGMKSVKIQEIKKCLDESKAVGSPNEKLPFVYAGERFVYLKKFWDYQEIINNYVKSGLIEKPDQDHLRDIIPRYFKKKSASYDWQKGAALIAATNRFCLITGGPGTGKTTTAARIIAILTELMEKESKKSPKILLAAPTGKAAARLSSAMSDAMDNLEAIKGKISLNQHQAVTVHRLLGLGYASPEPKFNKENPFPADIVLIDEASMLDIAMMAKIMDAMPEKAKLIIMGDKDQLSSVEPGAVLADICEAGPPEKFSKKIIPILGIDGSVPDITPVDEQGFFDCVVELDKSYRFSEKSGIGTLAGAIKKNDTQKAIDIIEKKEHKDICWIRPDTKTNLKTIMEEKIMGGINGLFSAKTPEKALDAMDEFRILCAMREGSWGVEGINRLVREILQERKKVPIKGDWYHLRPVMIKSNDYQLGLFNGDTGIVFSETGDENNLKVYFKAPETGIKSFHPARIGAHDTVYATTVHKSQGSEFDRVVLILPEKFTKVLSMELTYTAVTRAKKEFTLIAEEEVFRKAVSGKAIRTSGLCQRLLGLI